jgi:hypothetical protein
MYSRSKEWQRKRGNLYISGETRKVIELQEGGIYIDREKSASVRIFPYRVARKVQEKSVKWACKSRKGAICLQL